MDRSSTPLLLTVEEAARQLRIGRTQMFALISSGRVNSVKIGRSRRVPSAALDAYLTQLSRSGAVA